MGLDAFFSAIQRDGKSPLTITFSDGDTMTIYPPIEVVAITRDSPPSMSKLTFYDRNGERQSRTIGIGPLGKVSYRAPNGEEFAIWNVKKAESTACIMLGDFDRIMMEGPPASQKGRCLGLREEAIKGGCSMLREEAIVCLGQGLCVNDPVYGSGPQDLKCLAKDGVCPDLYTCMADREAREYSEPPRYHPLGKQNSRCPS